MNNNKNKANIMTMCVAITASDYQRMSEFYRVGLGLEATEDWGDEGGKNYVVDMGKEDKYNRPNRSWKKSKWKTTICSRVSRSSCSC